MRENDAVREGRTPAVTGEDARRALVLALAGVESVQTAAPVPVQKITAQCAAATGSRSAVCAEMVFRERAVQERVRLIHDLGFAVEIWDWTTKDLDALAATGARFTSMTGYVEGNFTDPDGADTLLRTAEQCVAAAFKLGTPNLNLHGTGLDTHGLPVRPVDAVTGPMWLAAEKALTRIAALGEREGVVFCLENLNTTMDHPGTPFARAADTRALVQAVDSPHLRMNLDLYHAQIGEGNLIQLIRDSIDWVGEIQVADVPGRCEPGTGEINSPAVASALHQTGYTGVVGLEAWASTDSHTALQRSHQAFSRPD